MIVAIPAPRAALFLGIDIGKKNHYVSYHAERWKHGQREIMHIRTEHIENSQSGFDRLKQRIHALRPGNVYALVERTGHYGDSLIEFLTAESVKLYAIQIQEKELIDKTDENDAKHLAQLLYQQVGLHIRPIKRELRIHPLLPPTETAKRLRGLVQRHADLVRELTRTKNRLRDIQNRLFPEFTQAIEDPNGPTALRIRATFPTPADVAAAPIADLLATRKKRASNPSNKVFLELQQLARNSVGVKNQPEIILEQGQLIETLYLLEKQIDELECAIAPIVSACREGEILQSLPMMSPMWAAYIIGGIGTIANFPSASKLCAYVGWIPNRRQSGKTLNSTTFSKAGNRLLKSVMFFVTLQAVKQPTVWRDIYGPLVERLCPYDAKLKKRVDRMKVIIRIGNQILRLIYLLLRKDYDLLQSLPEGAPIPKPTLYDEQYHRARQTGKPPSLI